MVWWHRPLKVLAPLAMIAAGIGGGAAVGARPASATSTFSFSRLAGSDRYGTAAALSQAAFPGGAVGAIMAAGAPGNFPDALAASYLAGYFSSPVLLTGTNSVPAATDQALKALKVADIAVVGGTSAVSAAVVSHLTSEGYKVTRVAGATRYDTAAAVAAIPPASHVGSAPGDGPTAVVASGLNFPDALVAGPMGYASGFPVELTDPSSLSPQTQQSLRSLGIKTVLIAGGTVAVSSNVESQIQALGINTIRFAGSDRTATATQLATFEVQKLGFSVSNIDLARGDDPGDSLAGAPYGGAGKTPLLLTQNPSTLGQADVTFAEAESGTLANGAIFGGPSAVSQAVQDQATNAASGGGAVVSLSASPSTIAGNGSTSSTISVTVTTMSGSPEPGDTVTFSSAGNPAAACGSVYPTSVTTNSAGQASASYTSSTSGGSCTLTATETSTGASASTTVTQTASNQVSVTASPAAIPANGTSQSAIVATIDSQSGAPVSGDAVTFTLYASVSGSCGTLSNTSATTNSSGQAAANYTASGVEGFCTVVATENQDGSSGSAQVTQTSPTTTPSTPKNTVGVSASPSSLPANGSSTSTLTATVTNASGPVSGDPISFTTSAASSGACGTLSSSQGTTNGSGQVTVTYTSSTTKGTCNVTATEANTGGTGTATVTQTTPYAVAVTSSASNLSDNGYSQATITATVTDPNNSSAPVSGDPVTFTESGTPTAACGTLTPGSAATGTNGQASTIYTASTTPGLCTITATESDNSSSGTVMVTQTVSTSQNNTVTVAASSSTIPANGAATSTITATVTNSSGAAVSNDSVAFTLSASPAGACGSVSPNPAVTGSNGKAQTTYTSSSTAGSCTITATESDNNSSGTVTITQAKNINSIAFTPNPATIGANGYDTTPLTVTVKDPNGNDVSGDLVTFALSGASPPGACGTLSSSTASTNGSGVASVTYHSSTTQGSCPVTVTEAGTNSSVTGTVIQAQPYLTAVASANNSATITVTYNQAILCNTVDSNGSDYSVTVNGTPLAQLGATISAAACPSGSPLDSTTVTLTMTGTGTNTNPQFKTGQVLVVTALKGADGNTVENLQMNQEPLNDANQATVQ
jgi:adhesin/invasin